MLGGEQWHLDKRVPVAIIVAFIMQTAAALVWAGSAGERLGQVEKRVETAASTAERTVRLEEQVVHVRASLARIERKLDSYLAAQKPPVPDR